MRTIHEDEPAIVGVSVDPVDSQEEFCTKENPTFRLLAGFRKKFVKVQPKPHSQEVLAALTELQK
jgi:peroxiredoxin